MVVLDHCLNETEDNIPKAMMLFSERQVPEGLALWELLQLPPKGPMGIAYQLSQLMLGLLSKLRKIRWLKVGKEPQHPTMPIKIAVHLMQSIDTLYSHAYPCRLLTNLTSELIVVHLQISTFTVAAETTSSSHPNSAIPVSRAILSYRSQ